MRRRRAAVRNSANANASQAASTKVQVERTVTTKNKTGEQRITLTASLTGGAALGHITFMALAKKKATTIALDPEVDRLLTRAARERGVSRSEFIRQQLALVLEQYRRHPKPLSAGVIRSLRERGDESELFGGRR